MNVLFLLVLIVAPCESLVTFSANTSAIWTAASPGRSYALLRPATIKLNTAAYSMIILVSAVPDSTRQQKYLSKYRLFVNGINTGIGPGRPDVSINAQTPGSTATVFDRIEVPTAVLTAFPKVISVALECFHTDGGKGAWAMLEAVVLDDKGVTIGKFQTGDGTWGAYNANQIFLSGVVDQADWGRINEDIDAAAMKNVTGWRTPQYDTSGWSAAEGRTPSNPPVAKTSQPLVVFEGISATSVKQMSNDRYFFDFGQERMAGIQLKIPAATVEAWGGAGTVVEVRCSEQLSRWSKNHVLFPELPGGSWPLGDWNAVPRYVSSFILTEGENTFEHHEYLGLFRWGEIRIKGGGERLVTDAGLDFSLSQWMVRYPWVEEASFTSSDPMLNKVWRLCYNTSKYTSLDTFTDSNVRERTPYEADGYIASKTWMALRAERNWTTHSTQFVLNNPTWPTEWKNYGVFLAYESYMETGDVTVAEDNWEILINNTGLPYIDTDSDLVNFTSTRSPPMASKWCQDLNKIDPHLGGECGNSEMCHIDASSGNPGCDNIDWLPKFRAGYVFSPTSSIINAYTVRSLEMMSELANATGSSHKDVGGSLAHQAMRTREAMLRRMYNSGDHRWCDGLCDGRETSNPSFHSQHYPLWLGLTPEEGVSWSLEYLAKSGMVGSTYSSNSLLHGLYNRGAGYDYGQTALGLMTQCGPHSWCRMLKAGAPTTWEHWEPHDGTHSHPWATTPASAIANGLMGIRNQAPGWSRWLAKPAPGSLLNASIQLPTPKGPISATYTRNPSPSLGLVGPKGTEAIVCMPTFAGWNASGISLVLDGKAISSRAIDNGAYLCLTTPIKGQQKHTVTVVHA